MQTLLHLQKVNRQKHQNKIQMNFLIFDNGLSSFNLINTIVSDFQYITLITTNPSSLNIPSASCLTIEEGNISNASNVIEMLAKHENDPFDAILILNLSLATSLHNVLQTLGRLKGKRPYLFLIFVNLENELDKNVIKILKESSQGIQWTIVICNDINSSATTKYRIETKSHSTNQKSIGATNLLAFLSNEFKTKKYLHQMIYLY
jgi:hypothetical protein